MIVDSTPHACGDTANQAGSSFFPIKQAITFEQQVEKMRDRGLVVSDERRVSRRLSEANYYRLRGYWLTLERDDIFIKGTTFDDIWEIYQLDRELRRWLWKPIGSIEIKLRTQFAYHFAQEISPTGYMSDMMYYSEKGYVNAMNNYVRELSRSYGQNVPCVKHNIDKYGVLPAWAAVEIMPLGTLSMLYGNIDSRGAAADVKKNVAKSFGTKPYYLTSWIRHLTTVRNIVAHHDRFYNRIMTIKPNLLGRDDSYKSDKQFPTFIVIRRIYERNWPDEWRVLGEDLKSRIGRHQSVDLRPMGFPSDWERVLGI